MIDERSRALPRCHDATASAGLLRHVEPALAFQLELFRMSNFDVKASVLESRSLHLYYGTCDGLTMGGTPVCDPLTLACAYTAAGVGRNRAGTGKQNPSDGRFFVRGTV